MTGKKKVAHASSLLPCHTEQRADMVGCNISESARCEVSLPMLCNSRTMRSLAVARDDKSAPPTHPAPFASAKQGAVRVYLKRFRGDFSTAASPTLEMTCSARGRVALPSHPRHIEQCFKNFYHNAARKAPHIEAELRAGISCPERGISGCRKATYRLFFVLFTPLRRYRG